MKRSLLLAVAAVLVLLVAACGNDDVVVGPGSPGDEVPTTPSDGSDDDMPTTPTDGSIDDPDIEPIDEGDQFPTDEAREAARGFLGMDESDLPPEVRIRRRGEEEFALTEDYVLGRVTVELDDTDGSGYRVTSLVVELPDGPETFDLEPG